MFSFAAAALVAVIGYFASRDNEKERRTYEQVGDDWLLRLHIRQDLKLIAMLLMGVILALGVIADRI